MKMRLIPLIFIMLALTFPISATSQSIQQSHIDANLPETFEEFQIILQRDLETYFSRFFGKPVTIEYELLRTAPTQSGVAYPKFYAWLNINDSEKQIEAGAVRVAAIDTVQIEVTHYVPQDKILQNPKMIENIFPGALCDGIRDRAIRNKSGA